METKYSRLEITWGWRKGRIKSYWLKGTEFVWGDEKVLEIGGEGYPTL